MKFFVFIAAALALSACHKNPDPAPTPVNPVPGDIELQYAGGVLRSFHSR